MVNNSTFVKPVMEHNKVLYFVAQIINRPRPCLIPLLLGIQGKQFTFSHFLLSPFFHFFFSSLSEFDLDILLQSVKSNIHWWRETAVAGG